MSIGQEEDDPLNEGFKRVKFEACDPFNPLGAKEILDVELIIQCCP